MRLLRAARFGRLLVVCSPEAALICPREQDRIARSLCAQAIGARLDADTPQVKAVSVPTRENRDVTDSQAITMTPTSRNEKTEVGRFELER